MIRLGFRFSFASFVLLSVVSVVVAQANEPTLTVGGSVPQAQRLTAASLSKLPRVTVKAKDHSGKESTFEGVSLVEVLKLAGVQFGESLRGKRLQEFLVVEATDGYKAVFALPEIDPAFTDRVIIQADRDGVRLTDKEGPWQVVVPGEKRQARWVRQVCGADSTGNVIAREK